MDTERIEKLKLLKYTLEADNDNFNMLQSLEKYFLGSAMSGGCRCKTSTVVSALNRFWEHTGKQEYNTIIQ